MLKIPYSKVYCNGNELNYLTQVLQSGWLTTAGRAIEFEQKFAQKVGATFACSVNSCTSALHLGLDALGVQPGDKVFVPDMTFTASAEVVRYMQADPVFLDVEYGTSLVTPEILEDAIYRHPEVKYFVLVHYAGQSAEMYRENGLGILDLCKKHGIKILEDAAHAFPTKFGNQYVGSFGDITCFSFYANKTITTGEGGMLVTQQEELYKRCKIMRLHGINRDVWDRFTSTRPSWEYDVVEPGYKYNMPDLNAAIGLAQLERADEFHQERLRIARYYMAHLQYISCLDLPKLTGPDSNHAWHIFQAILRPDAPVTRNEVIQQLADRSIGTSVHYKPLHQMSYYKNRYQLTASQFPVSEAIWQGNFSLPLYPFMTQMELEYVVQSLKEILKG